jgi:hypothetical protein
LSHTCSYHMCSRQDNIKKKECVQGRLFKSNCLILSIALWAMGNSSKYYTNKFSMFYSLLNILILTKCFWFSRWWFKLSQGLTMEIVWIVCDASYLFLILVLMGLYLKNQYKYTFIYFHIKTPYSLTSVFFFYVLIF